MPRPLPRRSPSTRSPKRSPKPPQRRSSPSPAKRPRPAPAPSPLPDLAEALRGARRIAVLGVGSELRGDDVAGVLVARRLAAWAAKAGAARIAAFDGGAAPENLTGELARFGPDAVVLVDAAHLGREPGAVELVPPERIAGLTFSTHMLPATIVLDFVRQSTGARTFVLGIQLAQKDVMAKPSKEIVSAVNLVVKAFRALEAEG